MDEWPLDLLPPRASRWALQGAAMQGGRPVFGPPALSLMTGGPFWTCKHSGVWIRKAVQLKVARALEGIADGGVTRFIVRSCEYRTAPGSPSPLPTVPHSDGTPFSDGAEYETGAMTARVAAPAVLRSTSLVVTFPTGVAPDTGDFSIVHPTKGERRYRAVRVFTDAGVTTLAIRPPLREAVTGGEEMDFATPGCVMTLTNAEDFLEDLELNRFAQASPQFTEAF